MCAAFDWLIDFLCIALLIGEIEAGVLVSDYIIIIKSTVTIVHFDIYLVEHPKTKMKINSFPVPFSSPNNTLFKHSQLLLHIALKIRNILYLVEWILIWSIEISKKFLHFFLVLKFVLFLFLFHWLLVFNPVVASLLSLAKNGFYIKCVTKTN